MDLTKALRYGAIGVGVIVGIAVVLWIVETIVGFFVNLLTTAITIAVLLAVLYVAVRAILWARSDDSGGAKEYDDDPLSTDVESEDELEDLLDDDREPEPERS